MGHQVPGRIAEVHQAVPVFGLCDQIVHSDALMRYATMLRHIRRGGERSRMRLRS
ncbi:hypothetical protein phiK7B1_162 [Pseudomonas phage phiK7B1]|nr:hypothetical protein phiK7B1_162 [Pseudomonas phage phiK7B1]